ncbi:MAG: helix-hairpin-helix domain-containing protein [candidate division WOR-3 bacterium]
MLIARALQRQTHADIVILPDAVLAWALPSGRLTRRDAFRIVPFDDELVRAHLADLELASVLSTEVSRNQHCPFVLGVDYQVAVPDSLQPGLPTRVIALTPESPKRSRSVLLTRGLALRAGLAGRNWEPVGLLTELFTRSLESLGIDTTGSALPQVRVPAVPGRININTATLEELQTLPGIGPRTAERIIQHRRASGPFQRIEDIMNVKGIGTVRFLRIKDRITI